MTLSPRAPSTWSTPFWAVCIVAMVTAGCGAGGAAVAPEPPTKTAEQELESAVRSYTSAFLSGQGEKAAALLSQRCDTPELRQQIVALSLAGSAFYGRAAIVSIEPVVDGDHATVTYRFNQPAIDQENQPWVREAGAWHYDKC